LENQEENAPNPIVKFIFGRFSFLLIGLAGLFFSRNMIYSYVFGPHKVELKNYKAATSGFIHSSYLILSGNKLIPLPIGEYFVPRNSSNKGFYAQPGTMARNYYYIFQEDSTRIVIKLPNGTDIPSTSQNDSIMNGDFTYTGKLSKIHDDNMIRVLYNSGTSIDTYVFEVEDASGEKAFAYIFLILFGLITIRTTIGIIAKGWH